MNNNYDRDGDLLYLEFSAFKATMSSREAGDGVVVHLRSDTGDVESVEVWNFLARASSADGIEFPFHLAHPVRVALPAAS